MRGCVVAISSHGAGILKPASERGKGENRWKAKGQVLDTGQGTGGVE